MPRGSRRSLGGATPNRKPDFGWSYTGACTIGNGDTIAGW